MERERRQKFGEITAEWVNMRVGLIHLPELAWKRVNLCPLIYSKRLKKKDTASASSQLFDTVQRQRGKRVTTAPVTAQVPIIL
jgi:hypothetical protein